MLILASAPHGTIEASGRSLVALTLDFEATDKIVECLNFVRNGQSGISTGITTRLGRHGRRGDRRWCGAATPVLDGGLSVTEGEGPSKVILSDPMPISWTVKPWITDTRTSTATVAIDTARTQFTVR